MNRVLPVSVAVMLLLWQGVSAAQDRVVLFQASKQAGPSFVLDSPGEISEVEVTHGGRTWSVVRSVALPPHVNIFRPVALADGSRIVWLALTASGSTVLCQYDIATGRASIIDIGSFERNAQVLADTTEVRVFVVERTKVTFLDARLRPESMVLPDPKPNFNAMIGDGQLFVHRYNAADPAGENTKDLIVINTRRREVVRRFSFGPASSIGTVHVSRTGQQLYHLYSVGFGPAAEQRLDLVSLTTGELVARANAIATNASPVTLFTLDEARGLVIHDEHVPGRPSRIVARDRQSLAFVAEFAPDILNGRRDLQLEQTPREAAIVVFSSANVAYQGLLRPCAPPGSTPRIDVFDGRTLERVNRVDVEVAWECPAIIPLPPR